MTRRRRILFVTPFAPSVTGRHGGARAVHGLASELVERHDVTLLHLDRDELDPAIAARCVAVHSVPAPQLGRWSTRAHGVAGVVRGRSLKATATAVSALCRRARELDGGDIVQVDSAILGDVLAATPEARRRILTIPDPAASLRELLPLRRDGLPFAHRLDAAAAVREERRALRHADVTVVYSDADRDVLRRSAPAARIETIALACDVPATALDPAGTADPAVLVFVGNYRHPPNVAAAITLATRILPGVRARHPRVQLELVGAAAPRELRALQGEAISVPGEVPRVADHLDRAALVVTPIDLGGGTRVKVLEALAAGKAVVASPRAAAGISARAGEEIAIAGDDEAMVDAICRLLADPAARRRMATRAREWALRELSWSAMADRYDALYAADED